MQELRGPVLMRRTSLSIIIFVVLLAAAAGTASAGSPFSYDEPSHSFFGFTFGYMKGMTLYHISSYDTTGSGVESELEFPLNTLLFGLEGSYRSSAESERSGFQFDYRWLTSLGGGSGKMKDSDWLTDDIDVFLVGSPNPGLDIYSESDADLKAMIIDLRLSYGAWATEEWNVGPLVGLLYEKFSYDISNVNQVGFGPYAPGYTESASGLVLTYEVTYTIPFLGIRAALHSTSSFDALLDLGYSPWATAEDKDDHLLRGKLSEGSTDGSVFIATLTADWEIQGADHILIRGQYLNIDTTGTQTQRWYRDEVTSTGTIPAGTTISGIDNRIDSEQKSLLIAYQVAF